MAYTISRVTYDFSSYTCTKRGIYVFTGSRDGGYSVTLGGTAEKLYSNSITAGTVGVFWAEVGQTITCSTAQYGQLSYVDGFDTKPKFTLLSQQTTTATTTGKANGIYIGAITAYSHYSPSSLNYSFTCTGASISTVAHPSAGWSRNAMSLIIPSSEATITTTCNSSEYKQAYIFQLQLPYEVEVNVEPVYSGTVTGDGTIYGGDTATLVATPNTNYIFKGWYQNSVLVSSNTTYSFVVNSNVSLEARFQRIWGLTLNTDGNGAIDAHRYGESLENATITVIANPHYHFLKYVIVGITIEEARLLTQNDNVIITQDNNELIILVSGTSESTTTPLNITLQRDVTVTAYFEEDDKFHITASTSFRYGSIYLSDNDVYSGTIVTIWARPFPDYNFVQWQDGSTENPRQLTITENVTLIAEYQRSFDSNGIYQYRCFIKDQLDMEAPPKAFMRVDTFDIKTDLLTNANSTINVLDTATNVNNGDVLVLYDPKGLTIYEGVVKSMDGDKITCSQMQSFYKGLWIYNVSPQDYLEHEVAVLLQDYADGKIYQSTYVDTLVAQRLGGITIDYIGSTTVNLPTDLDDNDKEKLTQKDMEKWIYELYENYGIVFDFEINLAGTNYVHIKMPTYEKIKVGNNMFAISDMSPITEIEETNRLIIFSSKKVYRTTYVATKTGIVEEPTLTTNRFDITNTKVVFSDDSVDTLIANNLPEQMYNHKLTFSLLVRNFIYEFGDFNLGGELDVWHNDDYYNTVLTGYEIKKQKNADITSVNFTCGKVRQALTKKLSIANLL